jgi:hypothetical protein
LFNATEFFKERAWLVWIIDLDVSALIIRVPAGDFPVCALLERALSDLLFE